MTSPDFETMDVETAKTLRNNEIHLGLALEALKEIRDLKSCLLADAQDIAQRTIEQLTDEDRL